MRAFLFVFLFLPFLLAGREHSDLKRPLCFEKSSGQLFSDVKFLVRGKNISYYFSDRGYSVVGRNADGTLSRADFFFESGQKIIPSAGNNFSRIVYHHAFRGADLEFTLVDGFMKKTVRVTDNSFNGRISFEQEGVSAREDMEDFRCVFTSGPFEFSESLLSDISLEFSQNSRGIFQPVYFLRVPCGNDFSILNSTVSWLTYLGGNSSDELFGIALANDSGVVVVGRTASADFPATPGVSQDTFAGNYDAVITRFDKNGNCLWSSFYGGTNFDGAYQVIALDSVFVVAGMTNSTDLPMINPTQSANGGSYDAFLLMLNDSGQFIRSTYYGGNGGDQGLAIAKGNNNEIVLAGSTTSNNLPNVSGYQSAMAGGIDAFISVWDNSFNMQWASYYGGTGVEDIHTVCVTPLNVIAFAGATRSFDFPVTANAWQAGLLNQPDNYMVEFDMNGNRLYATFFGGTNNEDANGIVGDEAGNIYLTGFTYSMDFPIQGTSFQTNISGQDDIYVSRFDSTGQLVWSTFVGGSGQDVAWGMTRLGKYIFVCGQTESPEFPVSANAIQATYSANSDGFVIKMDSTGQMVSGTFMGGSGVDALLGIVVDADTNVIACGDSYSTDLVTVNPYQPANHTSGDGYVVKFGMSEQLVSTPVEENENGFGVSVFPNPANDFIFVTSDERIVEEEIIDITGRVVVKENFSGTKMQVSTKALSAGSYFIRVRDEKDQQHVSAFTKGN